MTMLVFRLGEGREVEFDLSAEVVTLGRAGDNDIVVQNSWISSHHARFERIGDKVGLIDLQSHNGILLNGQRVTVAALRSGDVLTFGQLEAVFREVPDASPPLPAKPAAASRAAPPAASSAASPTTSPSAATAPPAAAARAPERLDRGQDGAGAGRNRPQAPIAPASGAPTPEPLAGKPSAVRPVTLVPPPYAMPVPVPVPIPAPTAARPPAAPDESTAAAPEPARAEPPLPVAADAPPSEATAPPPYPAVDGNWEKVHDFAKGLIKRLDLLDALLANVAERDAGTAAQLRPLRASLLELLREYSVEAYTVEVGKPLDVATRKKIHIVEPAKDPDGATEIAEVFRPGYVCQNGPGGTPTVLRKAEVRTARPNLTR